MTRGAMGTTLCGENIAGARAMFCDSRWPTLLVVLGVASGGGGVALGLSMRSRALTLAAAALGILLIAMTPLYAGSLPTS